MKILVFKRQIHIKSLHIIGKWLFEMYSGEVGKTRKLLSKLLIFSVGFISLILSDCPGVYPTTSCGDILRKKEVLTRKYLLASAVSSFLFDLSEFLQRILVT